MRGRAAQRTSKQKRLFRNTAQWPTWSKGRGVQGASGEAGVVGEGSAPPLSRLALLARPLLPCTRRSRGMAEVSICRRKEQNGEMHQLSQQRPLLHKGRQPPCTLSTVQPAGSCAMQC